MKINTLFKQILAGVLSFLIITMAQAGIPVWTFTPNPNFPPTAKVSPEGSVIVKYELTNFSHLAKTLNLVRRPHEAAITQIGSCVVGPASRTPGVPNPSCTLTLEIKGSLVPPSGLHGGPRVCTLGNPNQCYVPSPGLELNIDLAQPQPPAPKFSVGGTISGLMGELVLGINEVEYTTNTDGPFSTAPFLENGAHFIVRVLTQPPFQHCSVDNFEGTINGANNNSVIVTCSRSVDSFTLGGTLNNPSGIPVTLTNGTASLPIIRTNGPFTFPELLAQGTFYNVQATSPSQECTVSFGVGVITANVNNVVVTCGTPVNVNGTVTGLTGEEQATVVLNGQLNQVVGASNPAFTYAVATGAPYSIEATSLGKLCTPQPNCQGVAAAVNPTCIIDCVPQPLTLLTTPNTKEVIPVVPAGFASITVQNATANPAYNVRAVLPTSWDEVVQTGCPAVLPGNTSCILQLSSTMPFVGQVITLTADNAPLSPPKVAIAFSLDGFLVWQTTLTGPNTIESRVIDNTDVAQIQWGNVGVPTFANNFFEGMLNTTTITNTPGVGSSAAQACLSSNVGGATWYLPAICELGGVNLDCGNFANINTNLVKLGFDVGLANGQPPPGSGTVTVGHWSSTESNGVSLDCLPFTEPGSSANCAYVGFFQTNATTFQFSFGKQTGAPFTMFARCAAPITTTIP